MSLLTPFQLKNTNKVGFDSYLDKESEIGVGKEMGSQNKRNEEDEEDGDGPKLSLQPKQQLPSNEKERRRKWREKEEKKGSSLPATVNNG